jgi:electron transfer flavoprotein alpha subunit
MAKALLIALDNAEAEPLAAFAQRYGRPYDLLCLVGESPSDLGAEKAISTNAKDAPPADALTEFLEPVARSYDVVVAAATMFGKDFAPRLAARLDRPMVGDILEIVSADTFLRPMYAGNILATVRTSKPQFVASVRGTAFTNPSKSGESRRETLDMSAETKTKRVGASGKAGGRPDLSQANIVVSGGRPLKDSETFEELIGGLADALGGATGATRAAVDSGIAPNEMQVGQTGKIVAPQLYIAAGISGSTQHIAGMKDSKVIVAINTDPDAPIFEIADYGLVMDLYQAIPELIERVKRS